MCESFDVLQSSFSSATVMTNTFCDYGNGSMGNGIRKFAEEMFESGLEDGYKSGCFDGYSIGYVEGTIITTTFLGIAGLAIYGIKKFINKQKSKTNKKEATNNESIVTVNINCTENCTTNKRITESTEV